MILSTTAALLLVLSLTSPSVDARLRGLSHHDDQEFGQRRGLSNATIDLTSQMIGINDNEIGAGVAAGADDISQTDLLRMIIDCPMGMTHTDCTDQVRSLMDDVGGVGHTKMLYELPLAHAVALSIRESIASDMKLAVSALDGFELEEDRSREPFYLPESVRVLTEEEVMEGDDDIQEHHRNLQTVGSSELTYGLSMVNAPEAWSQFGTTGDGVRVCVIDSGLRSDHPDLNQNKIQGYAGVGTVRQWNSDASGHGTHVTGTIAAQPNGRGVAGVAPDVDVYVVRVFGQSGLFFGSDLLAAGEACVSAGSKIISMSLGGPGSSNAEQRFFNRLQNTENIMAIAASGNDGDRSNQDSFPASYSNVMSVAAVNRNRNIAGFSTHNEFVDIAGPGVDVRSTWNDGGFATISGTSMATPHVSGVAGLLFSFKKDATVAEVTNAMQASAVDRGAPGRDEFYGNGIVDALAALQLLSNNGGSPISPPVPAPTPTPSVPSPVASPTPVQDKCIDTTVTVITDGYGYENSFSLRNAGTNEIIFIERTLVSDTRYTRTTCLDPSLCYRFAILDSYGDGIFGSDRGAQIKFGDEIIFNRREIDSGEIFFFGGACP